MQTDQNKTNNNQFVSNQNYILTIYLIIWGFKKNLLAFNKKI